VDRETAFFKSSDNDLERVELFKYLGRLLSSNDNDTVVIKSNLKKAKAKWAEIRRVLGSEPIMPKTYARFYHAIILNVLLYGSESWEISKQVLMNLEAFNCKLARDEHGRPTAVSLDQNENLPPESPMCLA